MLEVHRVCGGEDMMVERMLAERWLMMGWMC